MYKFEKIINQGKEYVLKEKHNEWEMFCYSLYNKNQLKEIAVEIVEDCIASMKLLDEKKDSVEKIIHRVGRSWEGGVSFCFLILMIERFYKDNERFEKEYQELQRKNNASRKLDEILKIR